MVGGSLRHFINNSLCDSRGVRDDYLTGTYAAWGEFIWHNPLTVSRTFGFILVSSVRADHLFFKFIDDVDDCKNVTVRSADASIFTLRCSKGIRVSILESHRYGSMGRQTI